MQGQILRKLKIYLKIPFHSISDMVYTLDIRLTLLKNDSLSASEIVTVITSFDAGIVVLWNRKFRNMKAPSKVV